MVKASFPKYAPLVHTLCHTDISDPYGGSDEDYQQVAKQIYAGLNDLIKELKEH